MSVSAYSSRQFVRAVAATSTVTVSQIKLCFKQVRFKTVADSNSHVGDSGNIGFETGEITLNPDGGTLGSLTAARADYYRIELDLDNHCDSKKSMQVTLSSGRTISSEDPITLTVDGTFSLESDSVGLALDISSIAKNLATAERSTDLKTDSERASGTGTASRKSHSLKKGD